MGGLVVSGFSYWMQHVLLQPAINILAMALMAISKGALVEASLPWVGQAVQVSTGIFASLMFAVLSRRVLEGYILWNEGTPGDIGGTIFWPAIRVGIYSVLGTYLAYRAFAWGIWAAGAYMSAPLVSSLGVMNTLSSNLSSIPNVVIGTALFVTFFVVFGVLGLAVVTIQMAIRGAELTLFVIAAPLMAIGWLDKDGGVWNNWWQKLLGLAFAQIVQFVALKGLIMTSQWTMNGHLTLADLGIGASGLYVVGITMTGVYVALFTKVVFPLLLALGWIWVMLTGPSLVQGWLHRTGMGGTMRSGGSYMVTSGKAGVAARKLLGRG